MNLGIAALQEQARKRRVFFSFHYQEDIFRVNQIRNSWRFGRENDRESAGFFDASLWESSQRKSEDSLKALIRNGLNNTSVTCVLAGAHTYARRWVRYEIAQSVVRGNGLFTVKLDGLVSGGLLGFPSPGGPNPLDYIAIGARDDGKFYLYERSVGRLVGAEQWVPYADYTRSVNLPPSWVPPSIGFVRPLSWYCCLYRYQDDFGRLYFGDWADDAALK